MYRTFRGIVITAIAAGVTAAGVISASAGGFAIREQSAEGQGTSFAGAAAGGAGLGSMFWNPAIMTQYHGWNTSMSGTLILPQAKVTTSPATPTAAFGANSGTITQGAFAPASYTSYQLSDKLWIGLASNSRFGLITKYPYNGAWQASARTSKVFSVSFNPNIAYKVNQWLSIGAGVNIEYFKVRLTQGVGIPAAAAVLPGAPTLTLKGDSWAVGYTLGALITPMPGTSIGIGYRSRMTQNLKGDVNGFPFPVIGLAATNIQTNIVLPDQITIGLRQQITPSFTMLAGLEWTNWSVFKSFPVYSTGPIAPGAQITALGFQWKDGWFASVGGEYQWNRQLKLRTGVGYEWSPVNVSNRGLRLPDNDRVWMSAGLTYQWSQNLSVDLAYTHLYIPKAGISLTPGNPSFGGLLYFGTARAHFDIVSVGLNYKFGQDAPRVFAKY